MSHQYNLHMDIEALKSKLLWQMTGEEFLFLQQNGVEQSERQPYIVAPPKNTFTEFGASPNCSGVVFRLLTV